jgi:hypothetical protein
MAADYWIMAARALSRNFLIGIRIALRGRCINIPEACVVVRRWGNNVRTLYRISAMSTLLLLLLLMMMATSTAPAAEATLDFDDLSSTISPSDGTPNPNNGNRTADIPSGYEGFVWTHYPPLNGGGQITLAVIHADAFTGKPFSAAGDGDGNNYPFPSVKVAVRWVMDEFTTAPVPVPDSGVLFMVGITGLAIRVNKKRHA